MNLFSKDNNYGNIIHDAPIFYHLPLPLSFPLYLPLSILYFTLRLPAPPFTNFTSIFYSSLHNFSSKLIPLSFVL